MEACDTARRPPHGSLRHNKATTSNHVQVQLPCEVALAAEDVAAAGTCTAGGTRYWYVCRHLGHSWQLQNQASSPNFDAFFFRTIARRLQVHSGGVALSAPVGRSAPCAALAAAELAEGCDRGTEAGSQPTNKSRNCGTVSPSKSDFW